MLGKVRAGAKQLEIQMRSRLMEPEKVTPNLGIIKQSVTTIKKRGENGTSILFHSLLKAIEGVCVKQNNLIGTPFNRYLSFTHTFTAFGSGQIKPGLA